MLRLRPGQHGVDVCSSLIAMPGRLISATAECVGGSRDAHRFTFCASHGRPAREATGDVVGPRVVESAQRSGSKTRAGRSKGAPESFQFITYGKYL